jgi:hypothetical protein
MPTTQKATKKAAKPAARKAATVQKAAAPKEAATLPTCTLTFPFSLLPGELNGFRGAIIHAVEQLRPELEAAGMASDLFHNHEEGEGNKRLIRQPLVAYQLPPDGNGQGFPCLSGAGDGAKAIALLAANMPPQLRIYNRWFATTGFALQQRQLPVQPQETFSGYALHQWLALNPNNHSRYRAEGSLVGRIRLLEEVLTKNIQGWYMATGHPAAAAAVQLHITEITHIRQKSCGQLGRNMLLFDGSFACNMVLPPGMALGNAAAKGFGRVEPLHNIAP